MNLKDYYTDEAIQLGRFYIEELENSLEFPIGKENKRMLMEEFNNQKRILEEESYRVIRRKICDFSDESNNDEIAGFVKGVVALETLLFSDLGDRLNKSMETKV